MTILGPCVCQGCGELVVLVPRRRHRMRIRHGVRAELGSLPMGWLHPDLTTRCPGNVDKSLAIERMREGP